MPAFLFYYHMLKDASQSNENSCSLSLNRNEDELNRPVYALRSVLSSAMTKPLHIPACFSDFCPQEGQRQKTSVVSVELFSPRSAHTDSAWGTGQELGSMFSFFFHQSSVICSGESVCRQCSNWQDMSRQYQARHGRAVAEIARSNTSAAAQSHNSFYGKIFLFAFSHLEFL